MKYLITALSVFIISFSLMAAPTLIDLEKIEGIGAMPDTSMLTVTTSISGSHFVKYNYSNVKVFLSATNRLSCVVAEGTDVNGTFLGNEDNYSTISVIDADHPITVSSNFSGCAYKIYRKDKKFYAAHIYRSGEKGKEDANLKLMDDYARQKGWAEIQFIPTRGLIGKGNCDKVLIISQLKDKKITSVRIQIDKMGKAVKKDTF